jgi:hypothetical protein
MLKIDPPGCAPPYTFPLDRARFEVLKAFAVLAFTPATSWPLGGAVWPAESYGAHEAVSIHNGRPFLVGQSSIRSRSFLRSTSIDARSRTVNILRGITADGPSAVRKACSTER